MPACRFSWFRHVGLVRVGILSAYSFSVCQHVGLVSNFVRRRSKRGEAAEDIESAYRFSSWQHVSIAVSLARSIAETILSSWRLRVCLLSPAQ